MYTYKIPFTYQDLVASKGTAETAKTDADNKEKNTLYEQFSAIDKRYDSGEQGLGLEKLTYQPKTDEELLAETESSLQGNYALQKESIISAIEQMYNQLSGQKESAADKAALTQAEIDKQYDSRKESAEKDALRRGLARSSIITESIEEFDKGRISDKLGVQESLNKEIAGLDTAIAGLEGEKTAALGKFEISHAAEIEQKLLGLKAERDKKIEDVIKYNNTVQEKEAKYLGSAEKVKEAENIRIYRQEEKLAAVKAYYDGMDKAAAIAEFKADSAMKDHLGSYYTYMLNYLQNKK